MYKNKLVLFLVFLIVIFLITACSKSEEPGEVSDEQDEIHTEQEAPIELEEFTFTRENFPRMDGSPSTAPLAQAVAAVLLGETREDVSEMAIFTRTTQSYRDLAAGHSDILIAGEPSPEIFDDLAEKNITLSIAPIAVDALVFIVNSSNPVNSLTTDQIKSIYTGEITNWQQVGGENIDIEAFQRNEEATSQVLMQKLVMDWQPMANAPMINFSSLFDMDDAITAIKGFDGTAGAIGYTMFHYADAMKMAEGMKVISIDDVNPEAGTIANGSYPFINAYYAVINSNEPGDSYARIMYNWLQSKSGQEFINSEGYVSLAESAYTENLIHPDIRWGVKMDDSKLLPFIPPHSKHSRLSDEYIPELIISDNYGTIFPYSGAITMNDGSLRLSKYGFVTESGMVITDLIYDFISRAEYNTVNSNEPRPAYHIRLNTTEEDPDFGFQTINAAIGLDGSWITPFDYADIVFSDNVIFLMRDHESFDIDVYDYNGNLLYNILELEWANDISEDTWAEVLVYGISEGYGFIHLNNDTYGLIDALTGDLQQTEFVEAFMFSEGLAAVVPDSENGLWGFVDKNLEIVIEPGFVNEIAFNNNRAIAETPDGHQHIIDTRGEKLFSVTSEFFIVQQHDWMSFSVHKRESWEIPVFYSGDFTELEYPSFINEPGAEAFIQYIGNGWYFCMTEDGMWLFTETNTFQIPESRYFIDFVDGYIIYNEFTSDFTNISYGVMLPDGTEIISSIEVSSITPVKVDGVVEAFIINTNTTHGQFINEIYTRAFYELVDIRGNVFGSGLGVAQFNEAHQLYYIQGTDHFSWLDRSGNKIISIPSMGYSFD